jgi:REP element-mobilizing transposase RayT
MRTKTNPLPSRRSIRLKGYDYAEAGLYFVTICTHDKRCTLGRVIGDRGELSPLGRLVRGHWYDLPNHHAGLELDAFVVMPNHFHGIIVMHERLRDARAQQAAPLQPTKRAQPDSLTSVIRSFKSAVSRRAARELKIGHPVWQRNYYEHIIRNGDDLDDTRNYIAANPIKWRLDRENPDFRQA